MKKTKCKLLNLLLIFTIMSIVSSSLIVKDIYGYKDNETLPITVGPMNSVETQIPFEYYYLDICTPTHIDQEQDNLGEILTGSRTFYSKYNFKMGVNEYCQELCTKNFTSLDKELVRWMIARNYTVEWFADKLLAGYKVSEHETHYLTGIPIGLMISAEAEDALIYNHFTFTVNIHKEQMTKTSENIYTVVGFNIQPSSIRQSTLTGKKCAVSKEELNKNHRIETQHISEQEDMIFTYDVIFELSDIPFSSRWDHYRHLYNDYIHWFSLINSSLIILIFSFLVIHIFMRTLKRDIEIYNTRVAAEDFLDEFGWKQVCNDVFRRPAYGMLLCSMVGTGIQLCFMAVYSLFFASFGFMNPDKRGSILMIMIFLFVFMGVFAGYFSARFYKMLQGKDWLMNSFLTAFLYPAFAFSIFFAINFMFWMEKSSAALKFTDLLALLLLWVCCSSPLVLIGSFIGLKKKVMKNPCKVNAVPRGIPQKQWYFKISVLTVVSGIIPFAAIFIELVYIMASIWRHYIYWLFGFLFIVLIIIVVTCSEISIVLTYILLCKGDYNWWWKSYLISGSPAIYVFLYSVYYFFTNLELRRVSSIFIYFGSMTLLSSIIFLICGTMGFVFTYLFLRKIYSMIKID